MSRALIGWGAVVACLGLTLWASSDAYFPLTRALKYVPGRDVTGHFLIMGTLSAACVFAFASGLWRGKTIGATKIMVIVAVGVTVDEFAQAFIPSRTFSWLDLIASLAGVVLFGWLASRWLARRTLVSPDVASVSPEA